jgi:hypothetical protein
MTKAEKNRLSAVIRATEYMFLENISRSNLCLNIAPSPTDTDCWRGFWTTRRCWREYVCNFEISTPNWQEPQTRQAPSKLS